MTKNVQENRRTQRSAWVAPRVHKIAAGAAEVGFQNTGDGQLTGS